MAGKPNLNCEFPKGASAHCHHRNALPGAMPMVHACRSRPAGRSYKPRQWYGGSVKMRQFPDQVPPTVSAPCLLPRNSLGFPAVTKHINSFEGTGLLFAFAETLQPAQQPMVTSVVTIYTDGACSPNPGFGGWAAVIIEAGQKRQVTGGTAATTNNRMELQAAIEGLRALVVPTRVKLFTDSKYVRSGITSWVSQWERRGWKTLGKTPVKNQDLWQELSGLAKLHDIEWCWVRGHNGDPLNEECDQLAQAECRKCAGFQSGDQALAGLAGGPTNPSTSAPLK